MGKLHPEVRSPQLLPEIMPAAQDDDEANFYIEKPGYVRSTAINETIKFPSSRQRLLSGWRGCQFENGSAVWVIK